MPVVAGDGVRPELVHLVVAAVAVANHPKGARLPMLEPKVSLREVQYATMCYVDKARGTIDDLYRTIWHMGVQEYCDYMADHL